MDINIGVRQGSCLGPLLFLLCINGLPQAVKNSTVAMYADDTSIFYRFDDIHKLQEAMNKDPNTAIECLKGNKLPLNVARTKAMVISTKQKEKSLSRNNEELPLKIQEEPKDNFLITKYLGIQAGKNLDWKGHIKSCNIKNQ